MFFTGHQIMADKDMETGLGPNFTQRVPVLGHVEKSRENCKTAAVISLVRLTKSVGLCCHQGKINGLEQYRDKK